MSKIDEPKGEIVIYKDSSGPGVKVRLEDETVWLSQAQMAVLFGKDRDTISEHIQNIFKEAELSQNQTTRKFRVVQAEGKKQVERKVNFYNLDVIISIGYRVKSIRGTQFRIWATRQLRDHILKGYTVNQQRLKEGSLAKLKELERTVKFIQQAAESKRLEGYEKELLKIITDYAQTWVVLNKFDENKLGLESTHKAKSALEYEEVLSAIERFKNRLIKNKQATGIFGRDPRNRLQGILISVEQTFGGKPLYKSLEEKAANLLYLIIKDHPFMDGNKRIGSLLFLLYLIENNALMSKKGERKISESALTALALLVAQSKPDQKDTMVKLIVNLINN